MCSLVDVFGGLFCGGNVSFLVQSEWYEREETQVALLGVMFPTGDRRLFTVHLLYVGHCTRHKACKSVLNNPCSQEACRRGGNRTRHWLKKKKKKTRQYLYPETDAYTFSK